MPTTFGQEPITPVRRSTPPPKNNGGNGPGFFLLVAVIVIGLLLIDRQNNSQPQPEYVSSVQATNTPHRIVVQPPVIVRPTTVPERVRPTQIPQPVTTEEAVVEQPWVPPANNSGIFTSSFNVVQEVRNSPDLQVAAFTTVPVNTWVSIVCMWPDPGGWYSWYYIRDENYTGWTMDRFWYDYTYADGSLASWEDIPYC